MNNKVGILTFQYAQNYGALLQAFALKESLRKLGFKPIIIDRYPNNPQKIFWKTRLLYLIKGNIFNNFKNKFLKPITNRMLTPLDLDLIGQYNLDSIVVGSDQVWRLEHTDVGYNYFLDFIKDNSIKKISYAVSFGIEDWSSGESTIQDLKNLVNEFKSVSVREDSAINICLKLFGVNATLVLDPVLLLSKEDYICSFNLANHEFNSIATYILDNNNDKQKIINDISARLKSNIFNILPIRSNPSKWNLLFGMKISITDWVDRIANSKFIITDSFHGMVLSILFNKQFIVIGNEKRGLSRFTSLLKLVGLEDRIILNSYSIGSLVGSTINYEEVNQKISTLRSFSLNYLKSSLDE